MRGQERGDTSLREWKCIRYCNLCSESNAINVSHAHTRETTLYGSRAHRFQERRPSLHSLHAARTLEVSQYDTRPQVERMRAPCCMHKIIWRADRILPAAEHQVQNLSLFSSERCTWARAQRSLSLPLLLLRLAGSSSSFGRLALASFSLAQYPRALTWPRTRSWPCWRRRRGQPGGSAAPRQTGSPCTRPPHPWPQGRALPALRG